MNSRLAAILLVPFFACSASTTGGGTPGTNSSGTVCYARSQRADPRDGCFCEKVGEAGPPKDYQKVERCNPAYVGPKGMCCKNPTKGTCMCAYVGCDRDSLVSHCSCGFDHGSAILDTQTEVTGCTPETGGRCCANTGDGDCGCDKLGTMCGAEYGDRNVTLCTATTETPKCPEGYESTETCE